MMWSKRITLLVGLLLALAWALAYGAVPLCVISGVVNRTDTTGCPNCTITFTPNPPTGTQIVGGIAITPTIVSTKTDPVGNLSPFTLYQGTSMSVTVYDPSTGSTSAPRNVAVPYLAGATYVQLVSLAYIDPPPLFTTLQGLAVGTNTITFANSPYPVITSDFFIDCNASGGNVIIKLPATSGSGRWLHFEKTDTTTNTCTLTPSAGTADTVEGASTYVLTAPKQAIFLNDTELGIWRAHEVAIAGSGTMQWTGNSGNGTDFIKNVCVNGVCPVTAFGATCQAPGGTDATASVQAAITAAIGKAVYFPACPVDNTCYNISAPLTYQADNTTGAIRIYGDVAGATNADGGSTLCCNSTSGCVNITGPLAPNVGTRAPHVKISDLALRNTASGPIATGFLLTGLSEMMMENVTVSGLGGQPFTVAYDLVATQKSLFTDLRSIANTTGIATADSGAVSSNQNLFTRFTSDQSTTCVDIEGGASANTFDTPSCQTGSVGFLNHQTAGTGGFADNLIVGGEFEANSTADLNITADGVTVLDSYLFSGTISVHQGTGGRIQMFRTLTNGAVNLDATPNNINLLTGNIMNGTVTDNTGGKTNYAYNIGNGVIAGIKMGEIAINPLWSQLGFDNLVASSVSHRLLTAVNGGPFMPLSMLVAAGSAGLPSTAIASLTCGTPVVTSNANILATDYLQWAHGAEVVSGTNGNLIIHPSIAAGAVAFQECNPTAASITPPAETLTWSVTR